MQIVANAFHPDAEVQKLTMIFDGQVQGVHCQVLADSGASCNIISAALVDRLGLQIESPTEKAVLQMANGMEVDHLGHVTISVTIQGYRFAAVTCTVMHVHSCEWDVLLGQQWLTRARASVNFDDKCVTGYTRKGKPFRLRCKDNIAMADSACTDAKQLVITMVQAKRLARSGCKTFLSSVTQLLSSDVTLVEVPVSVHSLLQEFADVFPDDVPGLPPDRPGVAHTIPLIDPHAKPPSRPFYRLSRSEVMEAERQVKLLLEKKFIEPSTSPYGAPIETKGDVYASLTIRVTRV
jgi:hypothetical protein